MTSSVQLSYRFTTPIRDRERIDKKLKKSYEYIETVPEVCVCVSLPEGDTHTDSFYILYHVLLNRISYTHMTYSVFKAYVLYLV